MDKTLTTHASSGVATKQSLPLPRTLFSEGGSVVFSELLAESSFRPERFALELGAKQVAPPQRVQQQQECQDCQQDDQNNLLRGLSQQRAQQEQGAQNARDAQAHFDAKTEERLLVQKDQLARQEEQYRSQQIGQSDARASQKPSFDAEQQRQASAIRDRANGDRASAAIERGKAQRQQDARREQESLASRNQAAQANRETGETATETRRQDVSQDASQASRQNSPQDDSQNSLASLESSRTTQNTAQDKSSSNDNTNDKANDKATLETRAAPSEKQPSEEGIAAIKGEDKLENALTALGDAEGIDVFALQDAYAKTDKQTDKVAAALEQLGASASTGKISDTLANLAEAGPAEAGPAEAVPVEASPVETGTATATRVAQEGEPLVAAEEGRQIDPAAANSPTTTAASTTAASITAASITAASTTLASVATPLSLSAQISDKAPSSAESVLGDVSSNLRSNAARLSSQAQTSQAQTSQAQTSHLHTSLRAEGQTGQASPTSSSSAKESTRPPTTAQEQNNALSLRTTQSTPHKAATAQQVGGTTAALTQSNAAQSQPAQNLATQNLATQNLAAQNQAANVLAQAASATGVRSTQGAGAQQASALPEGITVRWNEEVRAHRPEGSRLSGQNALDSLRLARSSAQTQSYGSASTQTTGGGTTGSDAASSATLPNAASNAASNAANGLNGAQTEQAAAKLAARSAERLETIRERREASSTLAKGKTGGTSALLQSLAARLAGGARGEAAGSSQQGGNEARPAQTLGEARIGQTLGQLSGSSSQGSSSESSLNNGFSQSLQGQSSQASTRAGGATFSSTFTSASAFVREQVFVNVQRAVEGKVESLTVKLRPELLGRIEIRLDGDAAGRLQIVVLAERSETLDLLQRDAKQLEQALQDAGIRTQDQGLQFGLKGQGNAQAEGDAQQQGASKAASSEATGDPEDEATQAEENLAAVVERLQLRQDGHLNVEI